MAGRSRIEKRRARRGARSPRGGGRPWGGRLMEVHASDAPVSPLVDVPSLDDVTRALGGLDEDLSWTDAESRLLPLFERVRPYPAGVPAPLRALAPPGLMISLAIDVGPAFIHVTEQIRERWSLSLPDLVAQAIANVHARAAEVDPDEIVVGDIAGEPVAALQTGLGIGSTLVLAPGELGRIFGAEPRLFIAPMRDLIVGFAPEAYDVALEFFVEIAVQDPNCLHPRAFMFDGRTITVRPLEDGGAVASA